MKYILFILLTWLPVASHAESPEVRGVWLTTNGGLDWPGKVYEPVKQRKLLTDMLDKLEKAHFNLVIFQVQANGDVAWDSSIQPAMEALTGCGSDKLKYDVCRFVIDECHKRGMACYAWVVPFRVGSASHAAKYAKSKIKHPLKSHKKLCVKFNGTYYLDPGLPATRKYLTELYRELVKKYDFDGINLDYTRYPGAAFPDKASFSRNNPGKMDKDDWRRDNINRFVAEVYDMVKSEKPGMTVGSAPVGTYKNIKHYKNSTAFDTYHQDPGQWIESSHHDMIIPQMYWTEEAGFSDHLATWTKIAAGKKLIIGLAPYKIAEAGWTPEVVTSQIEKALSKPEVSGVCFFRTAHILGDHPKVKKLYEYLEKNTPDKSARRHSRHEDEESVEESVEKFLE